MLNEERLLSLVYILTHFSIEKLLSLLALTSKANLVCQNVHF